LRLSRVRRFLRALGYTRSSVGSEVAEATLLFTRRTTATTGTSASYLGTWAREAQCDQARLVRKE
jgi:hypothetical protein